MKILIAGASGLIGSELKRFAISRGHTVNTLGRTSNSYPDSFEWDPSKGEIDTNCLVGVDTIINLAGENIASGLWTASKKERILTSRINSTRTIVDALRSPTHQVTTLINASAIGYYKTGPAPQDESAEAGNDFLSTVCKEWEKEANKARELGIRVATPRIGIVLSKHGATLKQMLLPFKLGLGGKLGDGKANWSWVSLKDAVTSIMYVAENEILEGAINICSPQAVSNEEFTKTLGRTLSRPTFFNIPEKLLKFILGEMADQLMLADLVIVPKKLSDARYIFKDKDLEIFLKAELS